MNKPKSVYVHLIFRILKTENAKRVLKGRGRILVLEPEPEAPTNRLYRLIHNEDDAYERAAAAILESGLDVHATGEYETTWNFDDFAAMAEHLFGYFEKEPDRVVSLLRSWMLEDA